MSEPTITPALINAKQAGQLLAVPHTWILAQARAEAIPHIRLGRYVRFDAEELEAWLRSRATAPKRRTA